MHPKINIFLCGLSSIALTQEPTICPTGTSLGHRKSNESSCDMAGPHPRDSAWTLTSNGMGWCGSVAGLVLLLRDIGMRPGGSILIWSYPRIQAQVDTFFSLVVSSKANSTHMARCQKGRAK